MYFLYGAIALWVVYSISQYIVLYQHRSVVGKIGWLSALAGTISSSLLWYFLYNFANAVGNVIGSVFENQQQLYQMIMQIAQKVGTI